MARGEGDEIHRSLRDVLHPALEDTLLHHFSPLQGAGPIQYADFGCGTGATTLNHAKFVVETLKRKPDMSGRDIVCNFADLPSNDFNALFNLLPPIEVQGSGDACVEERTWFAAGVPGSQYGRMFPRSSLHVAIATLSLHFLPELPESVLDKSSPAYNKGFISAHGAPPAVAQAFAEASQKGLRKFFECRAEEMASGAVLAFYCCGRQDRAHPEIQYPDNTIIFIRTVEKAWKELVHEGIIAEELLDSFNVASCSPSIDDIREAIEHPTSAFHIRKLEYIHNCKPFPDNAGETMFPDAETFAKAISGMIKSSMGSKFSAHLGPKLADALIERIQLNYYKDYPEWKATNFFMPVQLSMAVLIRK